MWIICIGREKELIRLVDKQEIIISYFRDGKSQGQIEKETGISRKTIRKYIKRYENARNQLIDNKKSCRGFDRWDSRSSKVWFF